MGDQLTMCRDIRRRGKNKVAAQNCRRRKNDQIEEFRKMLESAEQQKEALRKKNERLNLIKRQEEEKLENLKQSILFGNNLSPEHYTIQVTKDDKVEIVARDCGEGETNTSAMKSFELYQEEMADVED